MAKTIVKPKSDEAAGDVTRAAKNNAPMVPNKTPSPDVISAPRAAHSGYGQNSYAGPSSLTPNQDSNMGVSPMAASIKSASERGSDAVLDEVVRRGVRAAGTSGRLSGEPGGVYEGVGESQLRPVSTKQAVPTHPAMVGSNAQHQPTKR